MIHFLLKVENCVITSTRDFFFLFFFVGSIDISSHDFAIPTFKDVGWSQVTSTLKPPISFPFSSCNLQSPPSRLHKEASSSLPLSLQGCSTESAHLYPQASNFSFKFSFISIMQPCNLNLQGHRWDHAQLYLTIGRAKALEVRLSVPQFAPRTFMNEQNCDK